MDDSSAFKYDVAISFLGVDEALAQSLADALGETCTVFHYAERQRELAGKDGVDAFTAVFHDEARVCVILYRQGWGATNWTRVEETAIKGRAFEAGWDFLIVIALETEAPVWLPKTKLWLGFTRFGVDGAVAVIEARVGEEGGQPQVETARARADRLSRLARANAQRNAFLHSTRGVLAAEDELRSLGEYIQSEIEAMRAQTPSVDIVWDRPEPGNAIGISTVSAAVSFGWSVQYSNSLAGACLLVREFNCAHRVGGHFRSPGEPISEEIWLFSQTLDGMPVWHEQHALNRLYPTEALAEHFMKRLLDRAYGAQSQAIEPQNPYFGPGWPTA